MKDAKGHGSDPKGYGIEMKVKPGREKELRPGLSKAEKKAAGNWSLLSRQMHFYSAPDHAQHVVNQLHLQYPHMQYRVASLTPRNDTRF